MKPKWWIDQVLSETRLRIEARWLLAWLGCRPAGWQYSVDSVRSAAGIGREKYFQLIGEIKDLGYIEVKHKRDRRGHIVHTALTLKNMASPECGKSRLRRKRDRSADSKDSGPECGKSAQTSYIDTTEPLPERQVSKPVLRIMSGGRNA